MAIKKPIPISFNLDSHNSVQSVCAVVHIDDKNTETLDLSLMQGGEHIAVSPNSTVTARFVRVKDKILISDNVPCAVQENGNIHIPIDNAAAHMLVGEIKIEVNIVDENDILTMQFPLVIRVNNTILADAEISPESEGTIPELLEEAREAAEDAAQAAEAATEAISTKQDKLTAGDNITISEENVISASSVSNDYTDLINKPSINNVTLSGNKSSDDLSLQDKLTAGENITIENGVISAKGGGVTDYADLSNRPTINGKILRPAPLDNSLGYLGLQRSMIGSIDESKIDQAMDTQTSDGKDSGFFALLGDNSVFNGSVLFQYRHTGYYPLNGNRYGQYGYGYYQFKFPRINSDGETIEPFLFRTSIPKKDGSLERVISDWQELTGGGAQIVSGVVNVNGTITFTDSEGNSFTTSGESVIGPDGFSPSATVQQTASGATITVTDKNGTTTANISNGQDGTDYVLTNADKQEIAQMVVNLLPNADMVSY